MEKDNIQFLQERLEQHARLHKDQIALTERGMEGTETSWTYGELFRHVQAMKRSLQAGSGLKPGERCLIADEDNPLEFIGAMLAVNALGAVAVPVKADFVQDEFNRCSFIAADSEAGLILAGEKQEQWKALLPNLPLLPLSPDVSGFEEGFAGTRKAPVREAGHLVMLLYTSGSTSRPKGVPMTEGGLSALLSGYAGQNGRGADSVTLSSLALHHAFALTSLLLTALYAGGRTVLLRRGAFISEPFLWCRCVSEYTVTHTGAPNYMLSMLSEAIREGSGHDGGMLSSLHSMILSTEFIQPDSVRVFLEAAEPLGLSPECLTGSFGMTESTSLMTLTAFQKGISRAYLQGSEATRKKETGAEAKPETIFSVGCPLPGYAAAVVDPKTGAEQPAGRVGEILIAGPSVLKDYWNRKGREDVFFEHQGRRYLRTGDLGFQLPSVTDPAQGELFICGRQKEVVMIRGENHSPHSIEALAVAQAPESVACAAAFSVPGENTEELVLLLGTAQEPSPEARREIADKISTALIRRMAVCPAALVFSPAPQFLKTESGKLRRGAMCERYRKGEWEGAAVSLQGEEREGEDVLAFITDFLCRFSDNPEVDTAAPFIALGLNSLLAQLLLAEIGQRYSVALAQGTIRTYRTPKALAEYVSGRLPYAGQKTELPPSPVRQTESGFPLTAVQKAYLAGRNGEIEWGGISCRYYMERDRENLDIHRFQRAVEKLVGRHPSLRTVIQLDFTQRVLEYAVIPIRVQATTAESKEQILADCREELETALLPLDGPLFRIALTQLNEQDWRVHVQLDMLCCDAMSIFVFWDDLEALYDGRALPEPGIDLQSGIARESMPHSMEKREKDREYWAGKIGAFPPAPQLPWDPKAEKVMKQPFGRRRYYLDPARLARLESVAVRLGLTVNTAFLTLFSELLSAFGSGSRFALSLTTMGRESFHPGVYHVIGDMTRLLLLAVERKDRPILQNALQLQANLLEDLQHTSYSAIDVARDIERETGEGQLYPVVFTNLLDLDKLTGTQSPFDKDAYSRSGTPQVLLDHQLLPSDGGVLVCWDTVDEAFAPGILDCMFSVYTALLEKALDAAFWQETLRDLRPETDCQVQNRANRTDQPIKACELLAGFRSQAERFPEKRAVLSEGVSYSYRQLQTRAGQVSELLRDKGVRSGERVMIQMDKSFELIAAIAGTVQMGAVYVPMPHDQPRERLREIFDQSEAAGLLAERAESAIGDIPVFSMGDADLYPGVWRGEAPEPEKLAYIIYTSGSTGKPKGVAVTHAAAMNTIAAVNDYLELTSEDCLIGLSAVSFDLSVYDIFGALSVGASLLVPSEADRVDPAGWMRLCKEAGVTVWNTVPALMDMFLDYCLATGKEPAGLPIREVILSGDWIPMDLCEKLRRVLPAARLTSMGGATEAAIWSNYYTVEEMDPDWVSIPYGFPLPNQFFHVLDEFGRPCPNGVGGRLHIGGKGLAEGYYREPALTAEAFFTHPHSGERLYNTGDYGRYIHSGELIFMGRRDTQVKINGYRIEIGEIQSALKKCGFSENTVAVVEERQGKKMIAFLKTSDSIDEAAVKREMKRFVPGYFIPDRILPVERYPVTANGKVDQKALIRQYREMADGVAGRPAAGKDSALSSQEREVLSLLRQELGFPDLQPQDDFLGLGVTSLALISLANKLETAFGHRANVNDMIHYRTVDQLLDYYRKTTREEVDGRLAEEDARAQREARKLAETDPYYDNPLIRIVREELRLPCVSPEDPLVTLGISSLSVIRIANQLESLYGRRPSVHDMLRYQTVRDMLDFYETNTDGDMNITPQEAQVEALSPWRDQPVLNCLREVLNVPQPRPRDSFTSLGVSSLEMIRVGNRLEGLYGHRPSIQDLSEQEDFQQLMDYYAGEEPKADPQEETATKQRQKIIGLFARCRDADIMIWPEGEKLRFKAPQGALTADLKKELSEEKAALLQYLQERSTVTSQELTPLQMAYVLGRQNDYILGDITAHYYVEFDTGELQTERLEEAVNEVILRNEILRTVITPEGRMQVYQTNPGYQLEQVFCGPDGTPLRDLRAEMKDHQFPLGRWPMFDVKVTSFPDGNRRIHIGLDCLILDGWSINMFLGQIIEAYAGKPIHTTDYTFRAYLEEERQWLRNKRYYRDAQAYWEKQIKALPPAPRLPLQRPLEEIEKPAFRRMQFDLDPALTLALFHRFKDYELTPSLALCTAYMKTLSKWSARPDLTLNLTMFNRQPVHPEVQEVLGDFTNIALLGYRAIPGADFLAQTAPVQAELWNAIEYRSYNVINLLGQLSEIHGDPLAAPYVFTSLIGGESEQSERILQDMGWQEGFAQTQTPQVVLDHQLYVKNGQLVLVWDYVNQAFSKEMLEEMFADYTGRVLRLAQNENWEGFYD